MAANQGGAGDRDASWGEDKAQWAERKLSKMEDRIRGPGGAFTTEREQRQPDDQTPASSHAKPECYNVTYTQRQSEELWQAVWVPVGAITNWYMKMAVLHVAVFSCVRRPLLSCAWEGNSSRLLRWDSDECGLRLQDSSHWSFDYPPHYRQRSLSLLPCILWTFSF